jgi:mannan endo-1,4-beta-mannosidase
LPTLRSCLALVGAAALLATCGPAQAGATPSGVGTSGTSLTLNGNQWWPVGVNAYQLGTNWNVNAGCGAQVDLDHYFGSLPPHTLSRVDIYSSMAVNKNTGQLDFSALDAVFDTAARYGQLLVAVLSGHDGACENERTKSRAWYAGGWRDTDSPGSPGAVPFATWLDTAVARWANSPALAGWTAVGEAEPSNCGSMDCAWRSRTCPAGSGAVLRSFFDATGARIRALDPDAVIWNGLAGGGQCGSAGDDYAMVAASPGVDVLEYHDYSPGPLADELRQRVGQAQAVGKPLVVAELGLPGGSCLPAAERKAQLSDAIAAQRAAGTAGALFWSYVPDPRTDQCTLDVGPDDPLLAMVGR